MKIKAIAFVLSLACIYFVRNAASSLLTLGFGRGWALGFGHGVALGLVIGVVAVVLCANWKTISRGMS